MVCDSPSDPPFCPHTAKGQPSATTRSNTDLDTDPGFMNPRITGPFPANLRSPLLLHLIHSNRRRVPALLPHRHKQTVQLRNKQTRPRSLYRSHLGYFAVVVAIRLLIHRHGTLAS